MQTCSHGHGFLTKARVVWGMLLEAAEPGLDKAVQVLQIGLKVQGLQRASQHVLSGALRGKGEEPTVRSAKRNAPAPHIPSRNLLACAKPGLSPLQGQGRTWQTRPTHSVTESCGLRQAGSLPSARVRKDLAKANTAPHALRSRMEIKTGAASVSDSA